MKNPIRSFIARTKRHPAIGNALSTVYQGQIPPDEGFIIDAHNVGTLSREMLRHFVVSNAATYYKAAGKMSPLLTKHRVQFLYLHEMAADAGDSFRDLLRMLGKYHRLISYSEAVDRVQTGKIDRPYISISVDDGKKSCRQMAEIMSEFGVKGCFFICPSIIGETDQKKIKEFCLQKLRWASSEFLSWDDVDAILKLGHEIGSHTMTHSLLTSLSGQQLQDEIAGSFAYIRKRTGSINHFSWPFGRFVHFNATAARTVFEAGFKSCASAERGCHVIKARSARGLCIRRDNTEVRFPIDHIMYFLANGSRTASARTNDWPEGWLETIEGEARCE